MDNLYEYFAFISYKHEDEKWARWLQNKLEHYRLPSSLRKQNILLPKRIRPVFRDKSDLSGGNLVSSIEKGLNQSKFLIIICSPLSAKSPWVSKEAQHFIDTGRSDSIIPFIVDGEPYSSISSNECYPTSLLNLKDNDEILGINIKEMGRNAAAIKVIARMFDLKFDSLWQRHIREKKKKRVGWLIGLVSILIVGFVVASFL